MLSETIIVLYLLMWYALIALSCLYIVSGIDDLFFDGYYWLWHLWRVWKTRHYEPLTYEKLAAQKEQLIAVMIPCWREAGVIGAMLRHNCNAIDYSNYYMFIGVYPNDPETILEVQGIAQLNQRVQCVMGEQDGPTNKASNLNGIYSAIKTFEASIDDPFTIFVLHDSEDVIHPLSFKLYNYLIPRKDMIQVPIFPLNVNPWNFTHWLYADEFAENHTKNIIVRESIRAHVPSAGVGTAFYRCALEILEHPTTGAPFSTDSLTEDYRTSLALRAHQLKQVFVTQSILRTQWKKRWFSRGYIQKRVRERIAVRALFPLDYKKAVRQKARWIIGIVFQEWRNGLWPKDWSVRYTLVHDKKSFITHFINGFGYVVFMFWFLYSIFTYASPQYPVLQECFDKKPWVWWLIVVASCLMCERLIQRTIATSRIYGFKAAFLVIPRAFYGNILNLHALIRAYRIYFTESKNKAINHQPLWDKTDHFFPGAHLLMPYRKKLGDLLLENGLINPAQLTEAIALQQKTGERLGNVLCQLNFINTTQLRYLLSTQYNLPLFPEQYLQAAKQQCALKLPNKTRKWLKRHQVNAVEVDSMNNILTVAIDDPTNEMLLSKIITYFSSYKMQFMLLSRE